MYGTLPRSFNSSEISYQRSRRRRILDVRHLNQYATFRLSPAEVGLIVPRQFEDEHSNQDLMLDEETLRATRFNSTQLSMSIDDSSEDYESSGSEEKLRSMSSIQKPPPPPPRRRPEPVSSPLTPSSSSSHSEERARSLPSTSVYKPLPPLPPSSDNGSDNTSDDRSSDESAATPRSMRNSASPSTSSSKKLSVTFCETDIIAGPSKGSNLFKSIFQKKSVTTKNVATTTSTTPTSRLRNSPERQITPTPILIPRPMSSHDKRHMPLAKRLSDKLKDPFGNRKC